MFKDFTDPEIGFVAASDTQPPPVVLEPRHPQWWLAGDTHLLLLGLARDLIEGGWIQGHLATNANDEPCFYDSNHAVNYCAIGAINRAMKQIPLPYHFRQFWQRILYRRVVKTLCITAAIPIWLNSDDEIKCFIPTGVYHKSIVHWNDHNDWLTVMTGFRCATCA